MILISKTSPVGRGVSALKQQRSRRLLFESLESRSMMHGSELNVFAFNFHELRRPPEHHFNEAAGHLEFVDRGRPAPRAERERAEGEFQPPPARPEFTDHRLETPQVPTINLRIVTIDPPPIRMTAVTQSDPARNQLIGNSSPIAADAAQNRPPLNPLAGSIAVLNPVPNSVPVVDNITALNRASKLNRAEQTASPLVTAHGRPAETKSEVSTPVNSGTLIESRKAASDHGAESGRLGLSGMLPLASGGDRLAFQSKPSQRDGKSELVTAVDREAIDWVMSERLADDFSSLAKVQTNQTVEFGNQFRGKSVILHQPSRTFRPGDVMTPVPEGMLAIETTAVTMHSTPVFRASIDPLAIVQMFVRAGEISGIQVPKSASEAANQCEARQPIWLQWLRDSRVSAAISVALGLIAVVTARQNNYAPLALVRKLQKNNLSGQ